MDINYSSFFNQVLNSSNIGLVVLDKEYNILKVNKFILINTEYEESSLINKNIDYLISTPDKSNSFTYQITMGILKKESLNITHEIKKSDGSYMWADISGEFYEDYSIWTIVPIMNINRKEKIIKEIVSSIYKKDNTSFMDAITLQLAKTLNADHTFIGEIQNGELCVKTISHSKDKKIAEGFKYNLKDTPCESVYNGKISVFPQNITKLFPNDQDLIDLGIEGYAGIPLFNEKQETFGLIVALYKEPINDPEFISSTISLFANIVVNEYERLKSEKSINEQAVYYQSIIDGVKEPLMIIDKDYNIVLMNKAANKNKVLKTIHDIDHPKCYEVSHKQDHPCDGIEHPCPLKEVIEKQKTITLTHLHPDENNNAHYVELTATPLFDKNDNFIGIIESSKDITEQIHTQAVLEQKEVLLIEQSKLAAMGEMLEAIAHQWRQPLSIISTSASAIQLQKEFNSLTDEMLTDNIDNIIESAVHLSDTIDDFRDFYKTDKKPKEYNLKNALQKSIDLIRSKLKNKNIEVIIDFEEQQAYGFEKEMIQVFMNILHNAKDAFDEKDQKHKIIKIEVFEQDKYLTLNIQDNAGGIKEDIINNVFDAKFTTKGDKEGTGIGLYMSKLIVEKAQGLIEVINKEFEYKEKTYKGACFIIKLLNS